jgi:hypothetical protein
MSLPMDNLGEAQPEPVPSVAADHRDVGRLP